MYREIQSKGANGTTTASVTFSADTGGRWEVVYVRVETDTSTQVLLLKQGTVTAGTFVVGANTAVVYNSGDFPVMVGTDEAAVTLTIAGASLCAIWAVAGLNELGAE